MKIVRVDGYDDERFSKESLFQHGCFVVDDQFPCEFKIINDNSAIINYHHYNEIDELINEFRFFSEHIVKFYTPSMNLIKTFEEVKYFWIDVNNIQPSQFYVSQDKLSAIEKFIKDGKDIIIPVVERHGEYIALDGHTRMFYAVNKDIQKIKVFITEADDYIYGFVAEAKKRKIYSPKDMILLSHTDYINKWYKFCDDFFKKINLITMKENDL